MDDALQAQQTSARMADLNGRLEAIEWNIARLLTQTQAQFTQLLGCHGRGGVRHEAGGLLRFREGNNVADTACAS